MKGSNKKNIYFPSVKRGIVDTLQVNLGYRCNQSCAHCHVNAGPNRSEMMDSKTVQLLPKLIKKYSFKTIDITGGAPELHPDFKFLVEKSRELGIDIIDRCNLTILLEKGQDDLDKFLANNKVIITASLPCYKEENVDKQRGIGVFDKSIKALRLLNNLGYGKPNSGLLLNLVYNPQGANLPAPQDQLMSLYKQILKDEYEIEFNQLLTITNMPIKRFKTYLKSIGELENYQSLLESSHNPDNLNSIMCRNIISIDWEGFLYDCDFNQQLGIGIKGSERHITDLIHNDIQLEGREVNVDNHCFGCTAGSGSSCSGALNA